MSFLDLILDNFLRDTGNDNVRDEKVRFARPEERRKMQSGMVDIFKEDPNTGRQIRLQRPGNQALQFQESLGLEAPKTQFKDFLESPTKSSFNILKSLGQITALGSPLHAMGLDIDLKRGDPVPSPVSGTVDFVGPRGGFGNQVRVRGNDGREYWLSHLDAANVKTGQQIQAGQPVGLGGATGNVIKGPGGDGSHLDLTVRDKSGTFLPPAGIRDLLKSFG